MSKVLAEFGAPWSRTLRAATLLSTSVLLVVMLSGILTGPRQLPLWWLAMVVIPGSVLLGALPFMVRGYGLTESAIEVRRLGWTTRLPLEGLTSIGGDAEALRRSVRIFGNGGLFSITGWYWNRRLGRFRVLLTDPARAVVLQYRDRKIVISPHDVQQFIVRARKLVELRDGKFSTPER